MTQGLSANTVLSHYRILTPLGSGGMGEVWLAEDTRLDRQVALKLLPSEFTQDADRVRRFMQEAKAASALNHPNIITVFDIGECEAGRFLVMERVAGRTLRSVIAEESSPELLVKLGTQMARALSAAHAAGITHRDIKPDNIMVRDDGYVKVLDFGLARLLPTNSGENAATLLEFTTPGMIVGTVAYMSPEQARGETVKAPSDIFALGIVLYELATGQHPFKADSLVGYLHGITLNTPAPLISLRPEVPAALDALVLRMLEKDASQRPTATQVAQALQEMERGGHTEQPRNVEYETKILPTPSGGTRAEEGFWIAVLPFKCRGTNTDLEALAEGLTEDIVTGLSRFSYLRVIALTSTLRYASDSSDVRAIGKELDARYVMEGSLRQAGSVLRIAVQLVDASTGVHLWAETYNRNFSSEAFFDLQDELTPRIVSTVADQYGALVHSMSESLRGRSAGQYSAHEALLRAFGYLERVTPEEHREVREILEAALESSPDHSGCQAMLSLIYQAEYSQGYNMRPDPLGRSLAVARKAVAASPTNSLAHYGLACTLFFQKDFLAFRPAAERSLALNRMDASTTAFLGLLIAYSGNWESGLHLTQRAIELNPHHPGWYHLGAFHNAYRNHDYRSSVDIALKINMPGYFVAHAALAAAYGQLGEEKRAHAALSELLALAPDIASFAREQLAKWFDAEHTEHHLDGLRKAGLKIAGDEDVEKTLPVAETNAATATSASIAVLPFGNLSPDPDNEFFADGLTDEVISDLSVVRALRVISRTSAMHFKGTNKDQRAIARELGVRYLLEGSVRRAGTSLRVTAQLIDAETDSHLWAEKYSGSIEDVFAIQEEISRKIVKALQLRLTDAEVQGIAERPIDNTAAYDCYIRARQEIYLFTGDALDRAQRLVDAGLKLIGENSLLLATRGMVSWYYLNFSIRLEEQYLDEAAAYAAKALALDPGSYFGIFLRGLVAAKRGDIESAIPDLLTAHEQKPGDSMFLNELIRHLLTAGQEQYEWARLVCDESLRIDPLAPLNWAQAAWRHFSAGRTLETVEAARRVFDLTERGNPARVYAAYYLALAGEREEAITVFEEEGSALSGNAYGSVSLFLSRALQGDAEGAVKYVTPQLEQAASWTEYLALFLADGYALIGHCDAALRWLRTAVDDGFINYPYLASRDPFLANVRSDPRFAELMRGVKARWEALSDNLPTPRQVSRPLRHTVGRDPERSILRAAFNAVKTRHSSLVCVAGEPGIGKTTLVEDFLGELATSEQTTIARGRCSERLAGTEAYLPLLEALEGLVRSDQTIAQLMRQLAPTWYAQVTTISGDSEESAQLLSEVKGASQERMKRELANFLQAVSESQPLVIFFDDLHWADVSTVDLISFLAGKFDAMQVLIVTTYRPSDMLLAKHPFLKIKPELQARALCRELLLEFLTENDIAEYLTLEFSGHRFTPEFPKLIHAKTEGSPLFMADLVRYLRDHNVIANESGVWSLAQALPDIERELPESVRGMIECKIAQLSEEGRRLLTVASVQGYEFDSAVIAHVLKLDAEVVEELLEELERVFSFVKLTSEAELPNRALTLKYRFIHVLYQNSLYDTLRATRKATLSREVAETLEEFHGDRNNAIASDLAALFAAGREHSKAADYFHMAAEHASQLFAAHEAAELARRGISALNSLPETTERAERELGLQLSLGVSLRTYKGFGNEETRKAYDRARELCNQTADSPQQFRVLFGLWESYQNQAQFGPGMEMAEQMLRVAGEDTAMLVVAHDAMCDNLTWLGDFTAARDQLEKGIAIYDFEKHRSNTLLYGYDSGLACLAFGSIVLWHLGYPDQARKMSEQASELSLRLADPVNIAFASSFAAWFHRLNRSLELAQQHAESAIDVSSKFDMAMFLGFGKIALGWAEIGQGRIDEGIARAREGGDLWRSTGAVLGSVWNFGILAEGHARAGRTEEALTVLNEALELAAKSRERFYEAELLRVKGELLIESEAEICFRRAIAIAQAQRAKSLELRATMSLARLFQKQGRIAEARKMLAEIYGWFTEGFDTLDLIEAKALMDELSAND